MPGPIPKRTAERRRANKPEIPVIKVSSPASPPALTWPDPDPGWGEVTVRWYRSLATCGMAKFYEDTDVAQAYLMAEVLDRLLSGAGTHSGTRGVSGQLFAAWLAGASELGTTEGARRRLRIELERGPVEVPNSVIQLAAYKRNLAGPN